MGGINREIVRGAPDTARDKEIEREREREREGDRDPENRKRTTEI